MKTTTGDDGKLRGCVSPPSKDSLMGTDLCLDNCASLPILFVNLIHDNPVTLSDQERTYRSELLNERFIIYLALRLEKTYEKWKKTPSYKVIPFF